MSYRHRECCKLATKLDRISGLPDEVLGHILSFLPTKCAVGTSILSTRWKYLFRLTTNLYFEDSYASSAGNDASEEEKEGRKESFKKFVYLVLALHQKSSITEFSLKCQNTYENSHIDIWVSAAILKKVQQLYLDLLGTVKERPSLPIIFFNSKTLVVLEISGCFELQVPNLTAVFFKEAMLAFILIHLRI
ncbi:F-box/LRR-repeat protein At3g58900-like [Spinacia oleracea]|uniref:F-box/LRR-repeat protein At3g58900-like n=1 Tax=Spinacia oleracea TaxID=3562 RepID=A0ABM3QPY3_SPIOL|nr:F-box/LRR-repeat protein At3g58900-like [Spinacia oleracea]